MTDQRHAEHAEHDVDAPRPARRPDPAGEEAAPRRRSNPLVIMGLVLIAVAGLVAMRVLPAARPGAQPAGAESPPRPQISIVVLSQDYLGLRGMLRQPLWTAAPPAATGPALPRPGAADRRPAIELMARSLELERVISGQQPAAVICGHTIAPGQAFLAVRPQDQSPFEFRLTAVEGRSATIVADEVQPPVEVRLSATAPPQGPELK